MAYTIIDMARATIGYDKFYEYVVEVCGDHKMGMMHSIASVVSYPSGRFDVQRNAYTLSWDGRVNNEPGQVFVDGQNLH